MSEFWTVLLQRLTGIVQFAGIVLGVFLTWQFVQTHSMGWALFYSILAGWFFLGLRDTLREWDDMYYLALEDEDEEEILGITDESSNIRS